MLIIIKRESAPPKKKKRSWQKLSVKKVCAIILWDKNVIYETLEYFNFIHYVLLRVNWRMDRSPVTMCHPCRD